MILSSWPPEKGQSLLLHACCAPCSSYVLEYLRGYYNITVFFYNPNISDQAEYAKRRDEMKRLLRLDGAAPPTGFIEGDYDPTRFYHAIRGLESAPEGGERCRRCYELRLGETARMAEAGGFDCFATTLTVSPHKNAAAINEIGLRAAPAYLPSDFKKKGGYSRSLELSRQYGLYRQDYCGCEYSIR